MKRRSLRGRSDPWDSMSTHRASETSTTYPHRIPDQSCVLYLLYRLSYFKPRLASAMVSIELRNPLRRSVVLCWELSVFGLLSVSSRRS
jgi:hypothetical protein